jgi:CRP/FNR family transcriptional regulator, cyclic AMP receptor protein
MHKDEPTLWPSQADPHKLLAQIGNGRATADYRKDQFIFEQGHVADTVFFIQQGRVKR